MVLLLQFDFRHQMVIISKKMGSLALLKDNFIYKI